MFAFKIKVEINNELLTKRQERVFDQLMKVNLQDTLLFWKRRFLARHFDRIAYNLYPREYRKKKRKGDPLVLSGHLKKHVLSQPGKVTGTSRRATMTLGLGRPAQYTGKLLKQKVIQRMAWLRSMGVRETYREAEAGILRSAGYGAKLVKMFQEMLTVIRGSEQQAMSKFLRDRIVRAFKTFTGKSEVTIIR